MNLLLGIDAGATKTKAILCDENGVRIGTGLSGPSSPATKNEIEIANALIEAITDASGGNEKIWAQCKATCIGSLQP